MSSFSLRTAPKIIPGEMPAPSKCGLSNIKQLALRAPCPSLCNGSMTPVKIIIGRRLARRRCAWRVLAIGPRISELANSSGAAGHIEASPRHLASWKARRAARGDIASAKCLFLWPAEAEQSPRTRDNHCLIRFGVAPYCMRRESEKVTRHSC